MLNRFRIFFIITVLLTVMLSDDASVLSARPAVQYSFRHLDTSDGLSANNVKSIVRDSLGFMWFGTKNGLNCYDGSGMRVFECFDEELRCGNNNIGALYEDENSMLWIGTDRGIYRYNPRTDRISFVGLTPDDGAMPNNWVQIIDGDRRGNVWALLPDEGVYRYSDGQVKHYAFSEGSTFKKVFPADICVSDDGGVWVVMSGDGVYRYVPSADSFVKVREPDGLDIPDRDFSVVCESSIGTIIVGTTRGHLYELDPRDETMRNLEFSASGNVYLRDIQCFDNELWIGTHVGLYVLNLSSGREEYISENPLDPFSLSDNTIYCIYRDRDGGAWIGSMFGGASYTPRRKFAFTNYGLKNGMS
ncbi:MAG: hybrid sensor histidine kinase/response regulator, partial [Muribaculaceae bacterium]|nr:hybrid sensor histidine kinase/response regulator [Muribaculaceae bacterium]